MALRWPLEGHFELFGALVAKWLSDGLWRVILSSSGLWWPNGSQMASGGSFGALLGSGGQMALRCPIEGHFEPFEQLNGVCWLSDGLWKVI